MQDTFFLSVFLSSSSALELHMSRYESHPTGQTMADIEKGSGYDFAERTIRLGFIRKVFGEFTHFCVINRQGLFFMLDLDTLGRFDINSTTIAHALY